jgi:FkbM family methyltransferase
VIVDGGLAAARERVYGASDHLLLLRRLAADVKSVSVSVSPAAGMRWLAALLVRFAECARTRSLAPADRAWERHGATFRTVNGVTIALPGPYVPGAREMYCRDVYLRTGLTMPAAGAWVVDLGANRGLFTVWAAATGAKVLAVEAQAGFGPEIRRLAVGNRVAERVHVEIALAAGCRVPGSGIGDEVWRTASHASPDRPADRSLPDLMTAYGIDRISLLKVDIEGGEFGVFAPGEDLSWLDRVDQIAREVHHGFGDVGALIGSFHRKGFSVTLTDADGHPVPVSSSELSYLYCRREAA